MHNRSLSQAILRFIVVMECVVATVTGTAQTVTVLGSTRDAPIYGVMQASDGNYYSSSTFPLTYSCADGTGGECSGISRITPLGVVTTFHNFESNSAGVNIDGLLPNPIIEAPDGYFYGTARIGGAGSQGTFFKISPTGVFTVLYTFNVDPASGADPGPVILGSDGNFYGLTEFGGVNLVKQPNGSYAQDAAGTLFRITSTGEFSVVHTFSSAEGVINTVSNFPSALIQGTDGSFYGAGVGAYDSTQPGNNAAPAVAYKVDQAGNLTILHKFATDGSEGSGVYGPFVAGPDGSFYGVAFSSGPMTGNYQFSNRLGTVFNFTASGSFQTLFTFPNPASGNQVDQNLTLGGDGNFYGTAKFGGNSPACTTSAGCGTIFQITPSGSFTVEHNFTGGTDSGFPAGPLVQINDGSFIGTAYTTTAYNLVFSPALPAPVQLSFSNSTTSPNQPLVLTWKVLNAFSATMQQCHASVQNSATGASAGAGMWAGPQTGTMMGGVYTGNATITPTAAGTYTYVLNCGGVETGSVTLAVGDGPTIVTSSLPNAAVGKTYSSLVQTIGGTQPYHYSSLGTLPPGLTIDGNLGVISGTPKQFGAYTFGVYVQDSATPPLSTTAAFMLTVASTLALSSTLANPTLNAPYSAALLSTGGYGGYKFVLTAGKLPDGLTLNATTGILSGMATAAGPYTFTITLTDGENPMAQVTQAFNVSTVVPPLAIVGGSFPKCTVEVLCEGQFTATGGVAPYSWTIAPGTKFPTGLTLDQDGFFTGKPLQMDNGIPDELEVQVTDSENPPVTASGANQLSIASGLQISSIDLSQATVGMAYAAPPPVATGGLPPYTWAIAPFDPAILPEYYADPKTGALMSLGPLTAGSFMFTYKVTDSEMNPASASTAASLTVVAPSLPTATILSVSSNTAGTGMAVTLTAKVSETGAVPTGVVVFYSGTTALGMATLDLTGLASLTTSFGAPGTFSLTAAYSGDGASAGSVSTPILETVVTPTVSASFSPGTLTLTSGQSGTITLTLTPTSGYTGTVSFSCGQLPPHVSCTFAPASVTIAAGATSLTDVLTIRTAATTSASLEMPRSGRGGSILSAFTLWLPASLLGLSGIRRRKSTLPRLLVLCLFALPLAGLVTLTGCGSTSPSATAAPGTYSIPIPRNLAGGQTQALMATVIVQ